MPHSKLDISISTKIPGNSPNKSKNNGESGELWDEFQKNVSEHDRVFELVYSL